MKVVISTCYGGYGLSYAAMLRYCELKGIEVWPEEGNFADMWTYWTVPPGLRVGSDENFHEWPLEERQAYNMMYDKQTVDCYKIDRADPVLVQVVEELGEDAKGRFADLKVIEIPDDVEWTIEEYDGWESIHEKHRVWGWMEAL